MNRACTRRIAVWATVAGVLAGAVLIGAGCGKARRVETKVRDDGTSVHTLTNNEIKVEGAVKYHAEFEEGNYSIEKRVLLDVQAVEKPGDPSSYAFLLTYMGANPLNIEPGRSLEIIADLNSHVLSAEGDAKRSRDPSGQFYTEALRYPVSGDMLNSTAAAERVRVIVKGRDGDAAGYFDETNFADFRRFVAEHVARR
jgi:hypothetical protein